ncbi:uncharacterized protein LOC129719549 [Wyeomyia smithii]|uniref:uncharacterized protein LOC129719549 n=1 Tax=Wyeomyia smithii TaxID=174621 RepID=UPI0024680A3D|nr:uncharacterized protein LOC129719549 [Wyeomyia smithii]
MIAIEKRWYDVALEKLDAYFKPRRQDVLERHKLKNMKQGAQESFSHYVLRLRQQLGDCGLEKYPKEVWIILEEIMLIDVIVEGCNLPELRRKIFEKDQSLSGIEALGASLESVRFQEKELKYGGNSDGGGQSEVCKIKTWNSKSERKQEKIMKRIAPRKTKNTNNRDEIICYGCGQQGHISKAPSCPARDQQCHICRKIGHFEKVAQFEGR